MASDAQRGQGRGAAAQRSAAEFPRGGASADVQAEVGGGEGEVDGARAACAGGRGSEARGAVGEESGQARPGHRAPRQGTGLRPQARRRGDIWRAGSGQRAAGSGRRAAQAGGQAGRQAGRAGQGRAGQGPRERVLAARAACSGNLPREWPRESLRERKSRPIWPKTPAMALGPRDAGLQRAACDAMRAKKSSRCRHRQPHGPGGGEGGGRQERREERCRAAILMLQC